jgi:hypothetical protein
MLKQFFFLICDAYQKIVVDYNMWFRDNATLSIWNFF